MVAHGRRHVCEGSRAKDRHADRAVQPLRERVGLLAVIVVFVLIVVDEGLEHAHIFQDVAVGVFDAVLAVEALLAQLPLRVQLVENRVRVAPLVVRED